MEKYLLAYTSIFSRHPEFGKFAYKAEGCGAFIEIWLIYVTYKVESRIKLFFTVESIVSLLFLIICLLLLRRWVTG